MWIIRDSALITKDRGLTPGDIHISDDRRAVYQIAKDGSMRRVRDAKALAYIFGKFAELKEKHDKEQEEKRVLQAQQKEQAANPLTSVDPKALSAVTTALTLGQQLPNPRNKVGIIHG